MIRMIHKSLAYNHSSQQAQVAPPKVCGDCLGCRLHARHQRAEML